VEARFCRGVLGEAGDGTVVVVLELDRWDVAAGAVEAAVVEPVDVLQGGQLDVVEALPLPTAADELGLVETDEGLGGGVDAPVSVKPPQKPSGERSAGGRRAQVSRASRRFRQRMISALL
jgi:hypothetical protein